MAVMKGWMLDRLGRYAGVDCICSHYLNGLNITKRVHTVEIMSAFCFKVLSFFLYKR